MKDLRLAVRALRATPIVTTVAILSLALGIGANTAIFSLVNTLVLRPLPVAEPGRLAIVSTAAGGGDRRLYSYATYEQIRRHDEVFSGALAYTDCCGKSVISLGGENEAVDRQYVSGDFFATLGLQAFRGRLFTTADNERGVPGGAAAVISYRLWQRLGGQDDLIGSRLTIDRTRSTIVGVTPPDFLGLEVGRAFDLALPIRLAAQLSSTPFDDDTVWLNLMVRLKPGISSAAAAATLRAVQPQIRLGAMPKKFPSRDFLTDPFTLQPAGTGRSELRQRFQSPLIVIFVVAALVLLIACANIGNVLLARGLARRHELSVHVALGASRARLVRRLLVESLLLSAAGASIGVALASWGSRAMVGQLSTARAPVVLDLALDWPVLAFAAATMAATAVLFGIAPALRATRIAPIEALKAHGRGAGGDSGAALSNSLVVSQVVLSLVLLVTAGLFVQTFQRLANVPIGFDRERVLVVSVNAPATPAVDRTALFQRLVRAVTDVPGVAAAGGSMNPPIVGSLSGDIVVAAPGTTAPADAARISDIDFVTPGWHAAYGIALHAGRGIDERDTLDAPGVMVVNETFAKRLFPGRSVVGMPLAVAFRLREYGDLPLGTKTIVGVVADSVFRSIRQSTPPMIYLPMAQRNGAVPQTGFYMGVRATSASPALLARSVRASLGVVSRDLTVSFQPLTQQVDESLAEDRLVATLSGLFGVLALLLAGLGLYGVTAHAVARRRNEIGIRMALGATPLGIVRLVQTRVCLLVGIGVAIGAIVSTWASRFVAALLYGLEPRDPVTLIAAAATLAAVGALAGWLPAWRASRMDPAQTLRET